MEGPFDSEIIIFFWMGA